MSNSAFAPVTYPEIGQAKAVGTAAAQARGYAAGYADGLRRAATEHAAAEMARHREQQATLAHAEDATRSALAALGAAATQVGTLALPLIQDAESTLVHAALQLAEAALQREVSGGHLTAADALRRALAVAPKEELIAVHLNPVDAATVGLESAAPAEIIADESMARGDAMAVLRDGWLDARIAAALARARTVLIEQHP